MTALGPAQQEIVFACVDLVGRAGGRQLQIGYLHDDVPVEQAAWFAHVQYNGARIFVENQPGPAEAADALARNLLHGARCRCGRLVALSQDGAIAYRDTAMADGSRWTVNEARTAGQCLWKRTGPRWEPSCPPPADPARPPRRERRRRR